VLSAVEGLEVLNPGFKSWVIPVTIAVIAVLFAYSHGTARSRACSVDHARLVRGDRGIGALPSAATLGCWGSESVLRLAISLNSTR